MATPLDQDEIWQVNMHLLMELDFWFDVMLSRWRPWRHFTQKCAAL